MYARRDFKERSSRRTSVAKKSLYKEASGGGVSVGFRARGSASTAAVENMRSGGARIGVEGSSAALLSFGVE